jgi:hypothetical protein
VRLVLAGGMALEERLASPKLESFHQRIAARCYLQTLVREETVGYVREKISRAGANPDEVFTAEALRTIHTATDGIPRLVNQLCDHALMLAALGGHQQLNVEGIEEAWADLQQLPVPWHEKPRTAAASDASSVVEFGQLDDAPAPAQSAAVTQVGPFRATVGDAAEARLNAIESGVAALREDGGPYSGADVPREGEPDDFSPADDSGTEVELIFHSAHDPFGGGWEEEEVVIDRYAILEQARLRKVASEEGRQIAAALDAALTPAGPKLAEVEEDFTPQPAFESSDRDADPIRPAASTLPFDPASDPLMPEVPSPSVLPRRAVASLREIAGDDRDLIVVADEPESRPPVTPARPRRQEYRQLFSTLRKK